MGQKPTPIWAKCRVLLLIGHNAIPLWPYSYTGDLKPVHQLLFPYCRREIPVDFADLQISFCVEWNILPADHIDAPHKAIIL